MSGDVDKLESNAPEDQRADLLDLAETRFVGPSWFAANDAAVCPLDDRWDVQSPRSIVGRSNQTVGVTVVTIPLALADPAHCVGGDIEHAKVLPVVGVPLVADGEVWEPKVVGSSASLQTPFVLHAQAELEELLDDYQFGL